MSCVSSTHYNKNPEGESNGQLRPAVSPANHGRLRLLPARAGKSRALDTFSFSFRIKVLFQREAQSHHCLEQIRASPGLKDLPEGNKGISS